MGEPKRIGVRMELDKPFKRHVSIYAGIRDYARQHPDWRLFLDEWVDESLTARRGRPLPYDGIIGRLTPLAGARAKRHDLPAVNVWLSSPAKGLPGVFCDWAACGRLVAEHLLSRGFRVLGALTHTNDRTTEIQAAAMKAFADEAGIDAWLGTVPITDAPTLVDSRQDTEVVKTWMDSWRVPLGLLVRSPIWARVIIDLAEQRGWGVPEQIAIVCSNNDELLCDFPAPGLTAVETPEHEQGYEAARMLDGLIDAKRIGISPFAAPQTVILSKVEIVSRHSTDFFAVADPLVGQALRYIAANLHKPLDPLRVARTVGVARRTLDAWFQKSLGVTVATEIARLRIERVKRELAASDDSVNAIARRTGFASTRTLQEQFHNSTGMSPSEFRMQAGRPLANAKGHRQPSGSARSS